MPFINVTQPDGTVELLDENSGASLMGVATAQGIAGIEAECGGNMSCATCHVHIAPEWQDRIGPAQGHEQTMLSYLDSYDPKASRLSCQIILQDEHEGLCVSVPPKDDF